MDEPRIPRYYVDPAARIAEILGAEEIPDTAELTYSFSQGYERLDYRSRPEHGGMHFAGAFHPGAGHCEGDGVCVWCGRTLF